MSEFANHPGKPLSPEHFRKAAEAVQADLDFDRLVKDLDHIALNYPTRIASPTGVHWDEFARLLRKRGWSAEPWASCMRVMNATITLTEGRLQITILEPRNPLPRVK